MLTAQAHSTPRHGGVLTAPARVSALLAFLHQNLLALLEQPINQCIYYPRHFKALGFLPLSLLALGKSGSEV